MQGVLEEHQQIVIVLVREAEHQAGKRLRARSRIVVNRHLDIGYSGEQRRLHVLSSGRDSHSPVDQRGGRTTGNAPRRAGHVDLGRVRGERRSR